LLLSAYFLVRESYSAYRDLLVSRRPQHLQAYPSTAAILADLVREHGDYNSIQFDLLLLGSENLYPWQAERIRCSFPSARVFSWYGHAEQVLFAPMCAGSESLHLHPAYGIGEVLDSSGNSVPPRESGELVGTSLWNLATPFIRYRTMDYATVGADSCNSCGRPFQLLDRIDGRLQEMILTGRGRYLSMTQINMHSDVFDNIKQFQFHQSQRGVITFRAVKKATFSDGDIPRIRYELEKKLGDDMELCIEFVERIEPNPSGKFRFLQQDLALNHGDNAIRG
jgi:phenylacetate-CoA ligase